LTHATWLRFGSFFKDRFLCRAISAEIAGETVALRDIVRVRNGRRRELKSILDSRQKTVDVLLQTEERAPGVTLPHATFTPEVVARLVRMTSGNLRLLTLLLPQIERVLSVNDAQVISVQIVEAARDSLVIGQA
jgi:hypothetical protein